MRFLVTGANGLVGQRLCRQLTGRGHTVTGAGRGPRRASGDFTWQTCELSSEPEVAAVVRSAEPEVIIHTASMTEVDACEKDPGAAFAANVLAAAHVARAARAANAHLVHVSTDYVFDGEKGPYGEEDIPNPRGTYAISKHMGEEAVRILAGSWAIARTAVVYGWPAAGRPNFGAWMVSALQKSQPVKLFEDQYVSPSLASNVAAMLAEIGERRLPGVWNTTGADVVNRVEFGRALCEVFGFDQSLLVPTKMADARLPSPRPARSGLRTAKVEAQLSAKPLRLGEALRQFHRDFLQG